MKFGTLATTREGLQAQLESARNSLYRMIETSANRGMTGRAVHYTTIDKDNARITKQRARLDSILQALKATA